MIREQLYKKTVDILFDAYFKGTLEHSDCNACAVGNIVAANCDEYVTQNRGFGWPRVFTTVTNSDGSHQQIITPDNYDGEAKRQIEVTGYSWKQLAKIELAFETADKGTSDEDYMFNGLVDVLEVLKEIHQVEDEPAQTSKTRFENHYATLTQ